MDEENLLIVERHFAERYDIIKKKIEALDKELKSVEVSLSNVRRELVG
jgi:hypothetical protein